MGSPAKPEDHKKNHKSQRSECLIELKEKAEK